MKHHTKLTIAAVLGMVASFAFAGQVYAANISVRVAQPKSPTNQNDFPISFVTLDTLNRTVTVTCFKKGPTDASYVQFGSDQVFTGGGNSGTCTTGSGVVNTEGTYSFKVTAAAGSDTAEESVSVNYTTSGPGDVRDYNKSQLNSCQYGIHFKTADDAGKTVKVEVYRSQSVPFTADSGSRTQTVTAGSNEAHDVTDTVPDCTKQWYFAVRAFDTAGNGSALIGDNVTTITVITPTGSAAQGAIPVSSTNGNILGVSTRGATGASGTSGETGQVEGLSTPSAEPTTTPAEDTRSYLQAHPKRSLAIGGVILLLGAYLYAQWSRKNPNA